MSTKDKLFLIFVFGLFIRLLFMPYTSHAATWERIGGEDFRFIWGFDPLVTDLGVGESFRLWDMASYIPYLILNYFGIRYAFLLVFIFKMPSVIADIIVLYSLYEITLLLSRDDKKALGVATVYFLNPYVIWMTSIVGHPDQLMAGFILLALLHLLQQKLVRSGLFLSIAVFFRYFPILLLPCFLVYLWHSHKKRKFLTHFLAAFSGTSLVLSVPYVTILAHLYTSSQLAFWDFLGTVLGAYRPVGIHTLALYTLPLGFKYNFTGFLARLGIWPLINSLFSAPVFLFVYFVSVGILLKRSSVSIHSLNQSAIILFSLFMLLRPLTQHHYLIWLLPFLFLEVSLFSGFSKYLPHVLWISSLAIDPIIETNIPIYDYPINVLPDSWYLIFDNWTLKESISVLHGLFLLTAVILSLSSANLENIVRAPTQSGKYPAYATTFTRKGTAAKSTKLVGKFLENKRAILGLLLVLSLVYLLAYPLAYNIRNGFIENSRVYWSSDTTYIATPTLTEGYVNFTNGKMIIGETNYNQSSFLNLRSVAWMYPFYSDVRKDASHMYLLVKGKAPMSAQSSSYAQIALNNKTIFDEKLVFKKGGLFTLDSAKYSSLFGSEPQVLIPVDMMLLKTENTLTFSVGSKTAWEINSIEVHVLSSLADTKTSAWSLIPYHTPILYSLFGSELIVGLIFLNRLRKWLGSG